MFSYFLLVSCDKICLMSHVQGFYKTGRFVFSFKVGPNYPHEPPKVKCETLVYHPNIDQQGNVCLNILREDWKPVLTINSIVYGLQYLFLEPNPEDPLNKEAAEVLTNNRRLFEQNVQKAMRGGYVGSTYFDRCLKWGGSVKDIHIDYCFKLLTRTLGDSSSCNPNLI